MALNAAAFESWSFPELEQCYTERDSLLYAVSLGFGQDPTDARQLRYAYEGALMAVPSMPSILCHPGRWTTAPELGVTLSKAVHGEQRVFLHRPLAGAGRLRARAKVLAIEDKGTKGAVIHAARSMFDADSGERVASVLHSTFCRADGGFGREFGCPPCAEPLPDRAPDVEVILQSRPEQALLYRLNNDMNPLHSDPAYAARAGFDRPILHGLCVYGMAAHALLAGALDYDATGLRSLECRFARPVFPGEQINFYIWRSPDRLHFCARVEARDCTVLDVGTALTGQDHPVPYYAQI